MEKPIRPVLRYHGGKWRLAPWILSFFPPHKVYVEPFGGAASILMLKERVNAECYNDLDSRVVNLFRVLRDEQKATELRRRLELTPYAREELEWAFLPPEDELDDAQKLIVLSFMGQGSDSATRGHRTGFRSRFSNDGRQLPSMEWATWPESIPVFTRRLTGVTIENRNALEVIERVDSTDTLFYVDPPYVHSTRTTGGAGKGYRYEMTDEDHRQLAEQLHKVKGMVIVSGYPAALYDRELYRDWIRFERRHIADRGKQSVEVIWINPACAAAQAQQEMFA